MDRLTRVRDGTRNLFRLIAARAYYPEGNPFGGARTDARHLPQLHNQVPDRRRIFCLSHVIQGREAGLTARGAPRRRAVPKISPPGLPSGGAGCFFFGAFGGRLGTAGPPTP